MTGVNELENLQGYNRFCSLPPSPERLCHWRYHLFKDKHGGKEHLKTQTPFCVSDTLSISRNLLLNVVNT